MAHITPYLNFNGNCREAMTFYQACLGGELALQKVAESPMAAQLPSEAGIGILHGSLTKDGAVLLYGSDMIGSTCVSGNQITVCVQCRSREELNGSFEKLAAGGQIVEPLHQTFLGATYGRLVDKFGNGWIFKYAKNQGQ